MSDDERREAALSAMAKLLGAWQAGAEAGPGGFPRPSQCGGALMRVTRDHAQQLAEMTHPGAIRWVVRAEFIPNDGEKHDWRVRCNGEITIDKLGYASALCPWCEGTERGVRAQLRQKLAEAAKSRSDDSGSKKSRWTR